VCTFLLKSLALVVRVLDGGNKGKAFSISDEGIISQLAAGFFSNIMLVAFDFI